MDIRHRYQTFQQKGLENIASQSQVIQTPSGIIEYALEGAEDGADILISHGSFGGYDQGLLSLYFLKNIKARFISPSHFGYLRTPMPVDASPQAQARAYVELLDTLGIEKTFIVGLSAGGLSALQFALRFNNRCSGIILLSAVSVRPVKAPPMRFIVEHVLTNEFLGWMLANYFPRFVTKSTGDNYSTISSDALLKNAFLNLAWPPFATQRRTGMLNDLHQADLLPNFPYENIIVPFLAIHGTADPFVPFETAKQLTTKVRGAKLLSLEKGGHLSFLIQQKRTRHSILNFLNRVSSV